MTTIEAVLTAIFVKPLYVATYYFVVGGLEFLASKLPNGKIRQALLKKH